jgi:hypothetical protein
VLLLQQVKQKVGAHKAIVITFQAEMAKFERQYARSQKVEYIGQLPRQIDGVQALAKVNEPNQD